MFGNDMATFPDFPAEIRAPAGHAERRLGLPGPHLRPRHPDPGRRAQRPGGHEPGRPEGQPRADGQGDHPPGQQRRLRGAEPDQGRLRREPPDRRLAGGLHGLRGADDLHHPGGVQGGRGQAPRRRALQELLRPGPGQLALHPPHRPDPGVDHRAVRLQAPGGRGQHAGLPGRLRLRRDGRVVRVELRGAARPPSSPASTSRSPATRPWPGASSRPPAWPACRCSSAATRSRRPRTSSTS